jgi:hypothetical protein
LEDASPLQVKPPAFTSAACLAAVSLAFFGASCGRDDAIPSPSPSPSPSVIPTPTPPAATPPPGGAGLCQGRVQDLAPHPLQPAAPPPVGRVFTDPEFGTRIRRITAVSSSEGENAVVKPMYSTIQAWNADESKLLLWHRGQGHELYDGRTYAFLRRPKLVSPTDIEQLLWDPTDPDVLYYPSNYNAIPNLMRYRVSTDASEVARRFEVCPTGDWGRVLSLGRDPMYLSWGPPSKVIGLACGETKFLYDVAHDQVIARGTNTASQNAPQPGPSGSLAYFEGWVLDAMLRAQRQLPLASAFEHASIGRSAASGHDLYNAVVFDPPPGGSEAADAGTLVSFDMQTGARRVVIGLATGYPYPPSGTHVSAVGHRRPGWVAVSVVGDPHGQGLLDGELLLANVDDGTVCRVGHHRSWAGEGRWGYWAEPHVVLSPTGTRLLFGSDWGNGGTVDTYVVELP